MGSSNRQLGWVLVWLGLFVWLGAPRLVDLLFPERVPDLFWVLSPAVAISLAVLGIFFIKQEKEQSQTPDSRADNTAPVPATHRSRLEQKERLSLWGLVALGLVLVEVLPRLDTATDRPGPLTLIGIGLSLIALMSALVYWGLRSQLRSIPGFLFYFVGYNIIIIIVKFMLSPASYYQANDTKPLVVLGLVDESSMLLFGGLVVLLLYSAVYATIYRLYRRRVKEFMITPHRAERRKVWATAILVLVLLAASGGAALAILLPVMAAANAAEYLRYAFSSWLGVVVAASLLAATGFAIKSFALVAEQARALRDASLLVSFFWFGLALIAVYHGLWVVYALLLGTIWPLKTIIPGGK